MKAANHTDKDVYLKIGKGTTKIKANSSVDIESPYKSYIKTKSDKTYETLCHDCKFNKGRIENDIICGNDGAKALLTFDSCIGKKKK